jgi:hypothetical protein
MRIGLRGVEMKKQKKDIRQIIEYNEKKGIRFTHRIKTKERAVFSVYIFRSNSKETIYLCKCSG